MFLLVWLDVTSPRSARCRPETSVRQLEIERYRRRRWRGRRRRLRRWRPCRRRRRHQRRIAAAGAAAQRGRSHVRRWRRLPQTSSASRWQRRSRVAAATAGADRGAAVPLAFRPRRTRDEPEGARLGGFESAGRRLPRADRHVQRRLGLGCGGERSRNETERTAASAERPAKRLGFGLGLGLELGLGFWRERTRRAARRSAEKFLEFRRSEDLGVAV